MKKGAFYPLAAKTLRDLLATPIAPIAALFVLLGSGIAFLFPSEFSVIPDFSFRAYASRIPSLASLFFPALCAGLWDAERKEGTLDLLLSYPASDWAIVLSKSLPVFLAFAATLALTVPLALSLQSLQDATSVPSLTGTLAPGYLMLLLHALSLASFSNYVALRFSGTVVPTIVSFATIASFSASHLLPQSMELSPSLARLCVELSLSWRLDRAFRGVIDSRDIVFFSVPAALFTALSARRMARIRRGS
jgi:ABC-2 type transport system permease protein